MAGGADDVHLDYRLKRRDDLFVLRRSNRAQVQYEAPHFVSAEDRRFGLAQPPRERAGSIVECYADGGDSGLWQ